MTIILILINIIIFITSITTTTSTLLILIMKKVVKKNSPGNAVQSPAPAPDDYPSYMLFYLSFRDRASLLTRQKVSRASDWFRPWLGGGAGGEVEILSVVCWDYRIIGMH